MARSSSGKPRSKKKKRLLTKKQFRILAAASAVALIVALASVIFFAVQRNQEQIYDLSQVGTGVPAVVQVHDFTCPVCTELRETVDGIQGEFDDSELMIRIADVFREDGLAFAARYTNARRATLLFIDGNGELAFERSGETSAAVLRDLFERHMTGEL